MELNHYTDQKIVQAILRRDTFITKEYLYRRYYPLFEVVCDKYYNFTNFADGNIEVFF